VHRQKKQAWWRRRNPGYAIAYRIDQRAAQTETPAVLRVPAPLNQLPWEVAKDQFGVQCADFIGALGALIVHTAIKQMSHTPFLILRHQRQTRGFRREQTLTAHG
jgi:hypothetical protein